MRIACVAYRDWALKIYSQLAKHYGVEHTVRIFWEMAGYDEEAIRDFKPDMILFYGWSDMVSIELIESVLCIMLHPSPLSKYRGGSPIQNQIIRGETKSAVTLFAMDAGVDTGTILAQEEMSLEGNIVDIYERMTKIGYRLTCNILDNGSHCIEQNHSEATTFKRRKPEQSEITLNEIQNNSAKYLYNKIRMLQDPYPNAFIRTVDGKKLMITEAHIKEDV